MPAVVAFILPALAGAGGAITIAGIAITTTTGALTLAGVALNVAGSLAFNAVATKLFRPDKPSIAPASLLVNVAQNTGPRIKHWGVIKVGYSIALSHVKDGGLSRIIVHGHGEFAEYLQYFLDKEEVFLDANGFVTNDQYQHNSGNLFEIWTGSGPTAKVRILSRVGQVPSPHYPELSTIIPEWTDNHRLDGLAQSLLVAYLPPLADINAMFPNREPVLEVVAKTGLVLDPRTGVTAYSDNLALCALDYELSPDGGNLAGWVDLDSFKVAADSSDKVMALATGGGEPQYRFAGSADLDEEPAKVRSHFAGACAGEYYVGPDGKLGFRVGEWIEPSFTITEDMVLGFSQDFDPDPVESYNISAFEYVDPDLNFATVTGDPWIDAERVAREGENKAQPFISCPSHRQCRHVVGQMMDRDNPQNEITIPCKPKAIVGLYEPVVAVDLPSFGISGVYRVRHRDLRADLAGITYKLSLIVQASFDQSLADQGTPPTYESLAGSADLVAPVNFSAVGSGVGGAAGISASWDAVVDRPDLTPRLEYTPAGTDAWQTIVLGQNATTGISGPLNNGQSYDVRCAWVTAGEKVGDYAFVLGVVASV